MTSKIPESNKYKFKWFSDMLKPVISHITEMFVFIWSKIMWFYLNPYRSLMILILIVFFICFYYFRKLSNYSHFFKKYSSYTSYFFITLGTFLTILVFGLFSDDKGEVTIKGWPKGEGYPEPGDTLLKKFKWSLMNAMRYYKDLNIIYLLLFVALLVLWLLISYSDLSYMMAIISMVATFIAFFVLLYKLYTKLEDGTMHGGAQRRLRRRPPIAPRDPILRVPNHHHPLRPPPLPLLGVALPLDVREAVAAAHAAKRVFTQIQANAAAANYVATRALSDLSGVFQSSTQDPDIRNVSMIERTRLKDAAKNTATAAATANAASAVAGVKYVAAANKAADIIAGIVASKNSVAVDAVAVATTANANAAKAHTKAAKLQHKADNANNFDPMLLGRLNRAKEEEAALSTEAAASNEASAVAAADAVNINVAAADAADKATIAVDDTAEAVYINDDAAAAWKKKPIWIRAAKFLLNVLTFKAPSRSIKIILLVEILCISLYLIIPIAKKYIYTNAVTKKVGILDAQADMGTDMAIIENEKELVSLLGGISLDWDNILSTGLYKKSKEGELTQNLEKQGFLPKQGKQNTLLSKIVGIPINIETAITYIQANSPVIIELKNKIAHQKSIKLEKDEKKKKSNNMIKTKILLEKPIYTDKKKIIATYEDIGDSHGSFNYNYSISAWFFIHNHSPSERIANTKFTSLLNYGGRPNLLFNVEKNTLRITIKNSLDKELTVFETDKIRLQRWNNIITNVNGGKLDIFINGKLVSSTTNPVPFMSYDTISTGEDNGISGGICNVTYYPTPLTLPEIKILYKSLKWETPPTI